MQTEEKGLDCDPLGLNTIWSSAEGCGKAQCIGHALSSLPKQTDRQTDRTVSWMEIKRQRHSDEDIDTHRQNDRWEVGGRYNKTYIERHTDGRIKIDTDRPKVNKKQIEGHTKGWRQTKTDKHHPPNLGAGHQLTG